MSKKMDVLAIGYPSIDSMIRINSIPVVGKTSTIISNNNEYWFGGCAVNITYLMNHFGYNCGLYMTVGNNFEKSGYKKFLEDKGLSLKFVTENQSYQTSYTKLLQTPDQEHITLFYPGPMKKDSVALTDFTDKDTHYGLITIGELNSNKYFLQNCKRNRIPVIFSMKGDYSSLDVEFLENVMEYSYIIFMNNIEYKQLNNMLRKSVLEYLDDNKVIIVTLGANGSIVFTKNHKEFVNAYELAKPIDTAGGGDAFIAGFLIEYFKGGTLRSSAANGAALSSFIIEGIGCLTNIPSPKELFERRKKIEELRNDDKANTILRAY